METNQPNKDQRERLNNLYRFQRHFYDLTRRFFLFGRDDLLRQMNVQASERVLEIGCGTGRNLIGLARLQPSAALYGLEAADEMLKTARAKTNALKPPPKIILRQGLAEEFSFRETFNLALPFDKIFISYSLSMFPNWREAVVNALGNLKPEGDIYILDFWDGAGLPRWFNRFLRWWLGLFKVYARPEFLEFLKESGNEGAGELTVTPVSRRYAFIAHFRKR